MNIYRYNYNFKFYASIDSDLTKFLYECAELKKDDYDNRRMLLDFIKLFCVPIDKVLSNPPDIQSYICFCADNFAKTTHSLKRTCYHNENTSKSKKEEWENNFRKVIYENLKEVFWGTDDVKRTKIFRQIQFITRMDNIDWDLLIAYTLIRSDDENGDKIKQIEDKLESLIE